MKKLAWYKKLYLMILMAILSYISLLIFGSIIFNLTDNTYIILFDVICYFPLFSIVYSILSYKYYRRFWAPSIIYTVLMAVFFIVMYGFSMFFAEDPLASELTLLEGLYLYVLATSISALVSVVIVLILLLIFKITKSIRGRFSD